jgi:hypothetical protein
MRYIPNRQIFQGKMLQSMLKKWKLSGRTSKKILAKLESIILATEQ